MGEDKKRSLTSKKYLAGEYVFHEGDLGDCGYIVEEGKIEISVNRDDRRIVIAVLEKGEIFGEMAIIDGSARSATARCTEPAVVSVVSKGQLRDRINKADPVVRLLLKVLIQRLRNDLESLEATQAEVHRKLNDLIEHPPAGSEMDSDSKNAIDRIKIESELSGALENGELRMYYQPIVDIKTGHVAGFEALLRWFHPELGQINPGTFITLAEETDLIVPIGRWVLHRAIADLATLQMSHSISSGNSKPLFMSVNISGRQLSDPTFFDELDIALKRGAISPKCIKLEITETALVEDEIAYEWIEKVSKRGLSISLDDFGTGYSSLSYLSQFNIDCLKLDKSFLDQILTDKKSLIIARSIIEMASGLKIPVVAEGIENEKQAKLLKGMACTYGQGYLFARPMPLEQAIDYLLGRVAA